MSRTSELPFTSDNRVRVVRFTPYMRGSGPTFTLQLFDGGTHDSAGRWRVAYRLTARSAGDKRAAVLFEGNDYFTHGAIDSDDAARGLMGFLTMRPGDTDDDYFDNYTAAQLAFASSHAEELSTEVYNRFGED